jgi:hypothetical protein
MTASRTPSAQTLAAFERVLGPDHPSTLLLRKNIAAAYLAAKRQIKGCAMTRRTGITTALAGLNPRVEATSPEEQPAGWRRTAPGIRHWRYDTY